MTDLKFLHAFNSIPGIGPVTLRALKNHFGNYETAWYANESALASVGITAAALQSILWKRPSIHPDKGLGTLIREGIWAIHEDDPNYPESLKEIPSPPAVIYGKGDISLLNTRSIAVVGTRKPTHYGLEAAEKITQRLADFLTIVSGLATGIDGRAHETALDSGGHTLAVLGSGIDQNSIFPPQHKGLARRIIENNGAVISEYAPGTPALKEHFPQRNRIVSGLSQGVLVIEAPERSGALITARLALEQNRDVFALPGSIFSLYSRGPLALIKEGAKCVTTAEDILEELGIEYNKEGAEKFAAGLGEKEKLIFEILTEPLGVDAIKVGTNLETSAIIATLSMLELKGLIKNTGGDTYQRIT
ncbi:MAG: DNA-protecting protein DprA [Candidatus Sungbacteria bacterium]|nr:DNA-protecting protein DprA [Candidatus Sungbacteria bacterium]